MSRIGSWNVRNKLEVGKITELVSEIKLQEQTLQDYGLKKKYGMQLAKDYKHVW